MMYKMNFFIDSGYDISDCKNSNNPSGMQVFRHKKISPPFANVLAWWGEGRIYRSLQLFSAAKVLEKLGLSKVFPLNRQVFSLMNHRKNAINNKKSLRSTALPTSWQSKTFQICNTIRTIKKCSFALLRNRKKYCMV